MLLMSDATLSRLLMRNIQMISPPLLLLLGPFFFFFFNILNATSSPSVPCTTSIGSAHHCSSFDAVFQLENSEIERIREERRGLQSSSRLTFYCSFFFLKVACRRLPPTVTSHVLLQQPKKNQRRTKQTIEMEKKKR